MTRDDLLRNVSWAAAIAAGVVLITIGKISKGLFGGAAITMGLGPLGAAFYLSRYGDKPTTLSAPAGQWLNAMGVLAITGMLYTIACLLVFGLPIAFVFGRILRSRISDTIELDYILGVTNLLPPLYWYFKLPKHAADRDRR